MQSHFFFCFCFCFCSVLQYLTDKFRLNYCQLWQALIYRDKAAIQHYCTELHAGHMYRLLACMVTARSWVKIESGLTKSTRTTAEVSNFMARAFCTLVWWIVMGRRVGVRCQPFSKLSHYCKWALRMIFKSFRFICISIQFSAYNFCSV